MKSTDNFFTFLLCGFKRKWTAWEMDKTPKDQVTCKQVIFHFCEDLKHVYARVSGHNSLKFHRGPKTILILVLYLLSQNPPRSERI